MEFERGSKETAADEEEAGSERNEEDEDDNEKKEEREDETLLDATVPESDKAVVEDTEGARGAEDGDDEAEEKGEFTNSGTDVANGTFTEEKRLCMGSSCCKNLF